MRRFAALAACLALLLGCGRDVAAEEDSPWRALFQDFFSCDELLSIGLSGQECIAVITEGGSTYSLRTHVSSSWKELESYPAFRCIQAPHEFWVLARKQEQRSWVWPDRSFEVARRVRSYPDILTLLADSRKHEAGWCNDYDTLIVDLSQPVYLCGGRYAIFAVSVTSIAAYRGKALFGASYVVIAEWRNEAWSMSKVLMMSFT